METEDFQTFENEVNYSSRQNKKFWDVKWRHEAELTPPHKATGMPRGFLKTCCAMSRIGILSTL